MYYMEYRDLLAFSVQITMSMHPWFDIYILWILNIPETLFQFPSWSYAQRLTCSYEYTLVFNFRYLIKYFQRSHSTSGFCYLNIPERIADYELPWHLLIRQPEPVAVSGWTTSTTTWCLEHSTFIWNDSLTIQ